MNTIEFPDEHHLRAAEGWAELLVFKEAAKELARIRPQFRNHPRELEVRWVIAANARKWSQALSLARKIAKLAPENPKGLAYEAISLMELHRPSAAYFLLHDVQRRFPGDEIMAYSLGCVCCVLGRPEEGFRWIRQAIRLGGIQVELRALEDPELQAMWKERRARRRR